MAALRTRRPFTAPPEDPLLDDAAPAVLDHSEQTQVVDNLEHLARNAQREYAIASAALSALVLLLLAFLPLPRTVASPFLARLVALSLAASLARHLYPLVRPSPSPSPTLAPLHPLDALPALPAALLALLVARTTAGTTQVRLLWGVAPLGAQLVAAVLRWEGARAVDEARGLRGLMYDAPEA
ncbi:hypothetical protein JCM3775_005864 [Rhodotorula graminis]